MGEILIPRRTKVEKSYELLADITVGAATTSVDITGLNIGKGDEVVLVSDISGNGAGYSIFSNINGDSTNANYYSQVLQADSSSPVAGRYNESSFSYVISSLKNFVTSRIKLTNSGYVIQQHSESRKYNSTSVYLQDSFSTTTFALSSITSISLKASITNGIGIGSRFQLYKIGGA